MILFEVARRVEQLEPGAPDPHAYERLLDRVDLLQRRLTKRFEQEECDGLLSEIRLLLPEAGVELDRLCYEHKAILRALADARRRNSRCTPLNVERLQEELDMVIGLLEGHEAREEALAAEALGLTGWMAPARKALAKQA